MRHHLSTTDAGSLAAIDWHAKILATVTEEDPAASREAMRGHLIQTEQDIDHFLGDQQIARATLG